MHARPEAAAIGVPAPGGEGSALQATGQRGPWLPAAGSVLPAVSGRSPLRGAPRCPRPRRSLGFSSWMWCLQPFVCLKIVTAINVGTWFSTKTDCPGGCQGGSAHGAGARGHRQAVSGRARGTARGGSRPSPAPDRPSSPWSRAPVCDAKVLRPVTLRSDVACPRQPQGCRVCGAALPDSEATSPASPRGSRPVRGGTCCHRECHTDRGSLNLISCDPDSHTRGTQHPPNIAWTRTLRWSQQFAGAGVPGTARRVARPLATLRRGSRSPEDAVPSDTLILAPGRQGSAGWAGGHGQAWPGQSGGAARPPATHAYPPGSADSLVFFVGAVGIEGQAPDWP